MKDIVIIGPPGSGKGTEAAPLALRLGLPHVSLGALFRAEIRANTPLGQEAASYVKQGTLAPGDLAVRVMGERLSKPDAARGVIIDGYPRTVEQAGLFENMLASQHRTLAHVVFLDVSDEVVMQRLAGRLVCVNSECGENFHDTAKPPKVAGVCDDCGSKVDRRADDVPDVIARRLGIYHDETEPMIARYREMGLLRHIDGARTIEEVFADVLKAVA